MSVLESGSAVDGRYLLREAIGSGGMGVVWRASDQQLGRDVALKFFPAPVTEFADDRRRYSEMHMLARIAHPGIVTLFDAKLDADPPYLVMELVSGEDLAARLRRGRLEPPAVRRIALALASGLAVLADHGAVHRDLKPSNILLPHDDTAVAAKLADFGIARLLGENPLTTTGVLLGTAAYLSPEQAAGRPVDPRSDVYSLGLVLLECLTGSPVFPGTAAESAAARLSREPQPPSWLGPDWGELLRGMVRTDPADRLDAAEVRDRFATLSDGAIGAQPTEPMRTAGSEPESAAVAGSTPDASTTPAPSSTGGPSPTRILPSAPASHARGPASRRAIAVAAGAAVAVVLIITGTLLAVRMQPSPAPTPSYPAVSGQLGAHLHQLEESVQP